MNNAPRYASYNDRVADLLGSAISREQSLQDTQSTQGEKELWIEEGL